MPQFNDNVPAYKPPKDLTADWRTFNKGLNILLKETEIDKAELAQADNIMLIGKGVPTKRWGHSIYFTAGATGSVRGLKGFYPSGASGGNELLAITDDGYLTKKNNSSFSLLAGASWLSGYDANMAQLDNRMYIVNNQRELVRYSSPTLVGFATIAQPTGLFATNISGASGTTSKSYRVSAVSNVGETLATGSYILNNQPPDLTDGTVRVVWTGVSTASILRGYNVYGRDAGNERFLGFVDASSTTFLDDGTSVPKEFTYPPTADSTGGPLCGVITRFADRLAFGQFTADPSKVLISGRVPLHERFDLASGGNFIKIEPDAGDNIVQIFGFQDRIIVFKERSIWQITIEIAQIGNFFVTIPTAKLITASHGCIAPRSVVAVENDILFLSRRGVYALGYEPGFAFDVLRTNEISVKVRPYLKGLTISQLKRAVATYHDNKYILAFPGLNQSIVFDRERLAWLGPWTFDGNVFETYFDSDNNEHLLMGYDDAPTVTEISENYGDDNGTAIATNLRTKKEDMGDWTLFKNIKNIFTSFRNVTGTANVDIRLEQRNGQTVTSKSFSINPNTGNTGWGADLFGNTEWGDSEGEVGSADVSEIIKWVNLNKAARTYQLVVTTSNRNDDYELLGIRTEARPIGAGYRPSSWRV